MFKKIKNTFFLISIFAFIFLVINHYFSDENIIFTNKSRSSYSLTLNQKDENLPLLSSDTNNIITYKNDLEEFKKSRRKRPWEDIISSKNE